MNLKPNQLVNINAHYARQYRHRRGDATEMDMAREIVDALDEIDWKLHELDTHDGHYVVPLAGGVALVEIDDTDYTYKVQTVTYLYRYMLEGVR